MMQVEIDPHAGFCFGVRRAIDTATDILDSGENLYSLGEMVHNEEEVHRLEDIGMHTIEHTSMANARGKNVLIRAHGEPPETYGKAKANNLKLIDATCPIVIKLQQRVKKAHEEMREKDGQIILIGNPKHPEVISLNGQTQHQSIIIEQMEDIHKINFSKPFRLFAQTTTAPKFFMQITQGIEKKINDMPGSTSDYNFRKSLCRYVSGRIPKIEAFSKQHDAIVFISGKNSSNGKALFAICKKHNPKSYFISKPEEFKSSWIKDAQSVGISGATSTPDWLMKSLAELIIEKAACI